MRYRGYTIPDSEKTVAWVKKWPAADANGEVEIEIRQVYEADDFGDGFTPELREKEERQRAKMTSKQ